MTVVAETVQDEAQAIPPIEQALRQRLGDLLRRYAAAPEARHLAIDPKPHHCVRCGLAGALGRVLGYRSPSKVVKGCLIVCRDGLECAARRAEQNRLSAPSESMAETFEAFRRLAER